MNEKAVAILDVFEDFLDSKGVNIPNKDRDDYGSDNTAILFGEDYSFLFNKVEEIIGKDLVPTVRDKLTDIINKAFLALTDEEKESGTTVEQKATRYEKWFKPMVDEIMAEVYDEQVSECINKFDMDMESHVQGNKWYTPTEAFNRDVQYKFLPECYDIVQKKKIKEFERTKTPYVILFSSESPKFPSENKVYTVLEFNALLTNVDSEFHNRKKYAEEKYGSADNYWDLEREDKLPEEDKGIQFGYDKTNFKFFNIPNPNNSEDTFSYEPSRYDIGDGNGSIFDYVRATCSHDEFIEALNELETQLYFNVDDKTKDVVRILEKITHDELTRDLETAMQNLDTAQQHYKELHKKWLIEASENEKVEAELASALNKIKQVYETHILSLFTRCKTLGNDSYVMNIIKRMVISELYKPSRDAQKAMNAEDYKTYNSIDWAKLRRIWEQFPANVNMDKYISELCLK